MILVEAATCKRCKNLYPVTFFETFSNTGKDGVKRVGRRRICPFCRSDPPKVYDRHLRRTFNLTLEDVVQMWKNQDERCLICNRTNLEFKKKPHVDHSHRTGKVRGLLCISCNAALGFVEKVGLDAIKDYLDKYDK